MQTLRPLGLGEVLDRAVTLTVRFFVPLALIYVVFAVPLGVVQYFAYRDVSHTLAEIMNAIQMQAAGGGRADPNALARTLSHAPTPSGLTGATFVLAFLIGPLPAAALIEAVSAYYVGRGVTFGSAYRVGLARWLPLIGVNLIYLTAGVALYVAVTLVALVLVFAAASLGHTAGIALGIGVGVALLTAAFAFAVVAVLALQTSYFTCVIEGEGAVRSFARGLTRIFSRIGLRRAFLFGIAYVAIGAGIAIVGFVGEAGLLALTRSAALATAYSTILRIVTVAFSTAFVGIFYYDLRVREEGYDLQLAAEAAVARSLPV